MKPTHHPPFLSAIVCIATLPLAISGCASHLPTLPWTDSASALAVMAARADAVQTFSSPASIFVKRRDGFTVSLDAAVVARVPGWLRIRAWKLGSAVMDVTVTPEGVWVVRQGDDANEPGAPSTGPEIMAEVWTLFTGRFFDEPGATIIDNGGPLFTVQRPLAGGPGTITCEIDRATLTARNWTITDGQGTERLSLALERYRMIDNIPWPLRLTANIAPAPPHTGPGAPAPDASRVSITFDEPEINPELPAAAFIPPRRATRTGGDPQPALRQ